MENISIYSVGLPYYLEPYSDVTSIRKFNSAARNSLVSLHSWNMLKLSGDAEDSTATMTYWWFPAKSCELASGKKHVNPWAVFQKESPPQKWSVTIITWLNHLIINVSPFTIGSPHLKNNIASVRRPSNGSSVLSPAKSQSVDQHLCTARPWERFALETAKNGDRTCKNCWCVLLQTFTWLWKWMIFPEMI